MENIGEIIQCYEALHDPTGAHVQEASEKLLIIYSNPAFFQTIINLIVSDEVQDEFIRRHGVVGIGKMVNTFYPKASNENQAAIFSSLLNLFICPKSEYVRYYIRDFVQKSMSFEIIHIAQSFVQTCAQNGTDIELEAALYLLTMMIAYQEDPSNLLGISLPMIEKGLNSNSNKVQLAAVLHGINIANIIPEDENNQILFSKYMGCSIKLLEFYALSNSLEYEKQLSDLVKGISYVVDQGTDDINLNEILHACLTLLSNPNISIQHKSQVQILSDILIINMVDEIVNDSNILQAIFQVYFQLAQSMYHESDSFDLSSHNVFSAICVELSDFQNVLELIWSIVSNLAQTPPGRFASIVALYYSLSGGKDFYSSKINDLANLFCSGLQDSSYCICEASALAISELASTQKTKIKGVCDALITTLLNRLSTDPLPEFVDCINSIVHAVPDIGNIFNNIFNAIAQLLQIPDNTMHHSLFNCLYSLVKYSPKLARHHFQSIFNLAQTVLSSNNESSEFLKGTAIGIVSNLSNSARKEFMPLVPQFLQLIMSNLASNDPQIVYESVTAYGHLLQNYSDLIKDTALAVLPKLIELASKDISEKEDEQEIFAGDDEEDQDFDSKIEPIINIVVSSIRVASCLLATYPDLILHNFASIINVIQSQLAVGDSDCALGCSQGCVFLVEGLTKIGFNQQTQPLLTDLVKLLSQIVASDVSGPDCAGSAFTAISDVIAGDEQIGIICFLPSADSILTTIKDIFEGQMLYQAGKLNYMENLHVPALRVLREVMAAMKESSIRVIQPFIPLFNGLYEHKSIDIRNLSLQFFGDLVYWASNGLNDEFKRNTFILALDAAQKWNSPFAFGIFKQLAIKAPQIIQGDLEKVLHLIKEQLESSEAKSDELMSIQDNAVSALGMIAMKIMQNNFPIQEFLASALKNMPAQLEAEENNDHIDFFFWLYQHAGNNQTLHLFAPVPIRLFSDPIEQLEEYCVSQENINKMLQVLKNFSRAPNFQQICMQACDNDEYKIQNVFDALQY